MTQGQTVRVLIVDDSAMVRELLSRGLSSDPEIEVIGKASNPYTARDLIVKLKPDVLTMDIEMPRMDGVTFLKRLMPAMPIPTVVIASLSERGKDITVRALEAGAVDVIPKPQRALVSGFSEMMRDICARVKAAATAKVGPGTQTLEAEEEPVQPEKPADFRTMEFLPNKLIAIGSSTGGVDALSKVLPSFPANAPATVIVQHMPNEFTSSFARRLNNLCKMNVREASDGDAVKQGTILIAPGGDRHMILKRGSRGLFVSLIEGPPVNYSCPSIDVLFDTVASQVGRHAVAAILTGMGKDGAKGLLKIRRAGGTGFAQDERSSVVFGMPKAAMEVGGAQRLVPLTNIAATLLMSAGSVRASA